MRDHTLGYYLDQANSLTPTASMLRDVSTSDWWKAVEPFFDDLIWQYFSEREVFYTDKFDPRNPTDTIYNILRSFAINLKTRAYTYSKLYETTILEYNPLYNVDAFEFEERKLDQTGTNEHTKTGTDSSVRSGNETDAKAGKEANTRTGSEKLDISGTDTEITSRTTYDSATFYDVEKKEKTPTQREDETTYNNVKDETSFTDRVDTHTFNDVTDDTTYNTSDLDNRNLHDKESIEKRRYGNIGVTKSTELIRDQRKTVEFDFYKRIVSDCVNCVSYALY